MVQVLQLSRSNFLRWDVIDLYIRLIVGGTHIPYGGSLHLLYRRFLVDVDRTTGRRSDIFCLDDATGVWSPFKTRLVLRYDVYPWLSCIPSCLSKVYPFLVFFYYQNWNVGVWLIRRISLQKLVSATTKIPQTIYTLSQRHHPFLFVWRFWQSGTSLSTWHLIIRVIRVFLTILTNQL